MAEGRTPGELLHAEDGAELGDLEQDEGSPGEENLLDLEEIPPEAAPAPLPPPPPPSRPARPAAPSRRVTRTTVTEDATAPAGNGGAPVKPTGPANPLDLLVAEGAQVIIDRVGPPSWNFRPLDPGRYLGHCGKKPATMDLPERIRTEWGPGWYLCKGKNSAGAVTEWTIRLAGRPRPLAPEEPDDEDETETDHPVGPWPPADPRRVLYGYPYPAPLGAPPIPHYGAPPPPMWNPYQPVMAPPRDEKTAAEIEALKSMVASLTAAVERTKDAERSKSDTVISEFMQTQLTRSENELAAKKLEIEAESDRWKAQLAEEQRKAKETAEIREKELKADIEKHEATVRLEVERLKAQQAETAMRLQQDTARAHENAEIERARAEREAAQQKTFYERLLEIQKQQTDAIAAQRQDISSVFSTFTDSVKAMKEARDLLGQNDSEPPGMAATITKGAVDALDKLADIAAKRQQAQPGYVLTQLANGQVVAVPVAQQGALPQQAGGAPGSGAGGKAVDKDTQDLAELLGALTQAMLEMRKPEAYVGLLKERPELAAKLRMAPNPGVLLAHVDGMLKEDYPEVIIQRLDAFSRAARTETGQRWVARYLEALRGG